MKDKTDGDRVEEITMSQQRYVETISDLMVSRGHVRTTDLAERLAVSKPSVSEAVKRLIELEIAQRKSWHEIELTDKGMELARQLDRRHRILLRFMVDVLAMDTEKADRLACSMERTADKEFVDRLIRLAEFLESECGDHTVSMYRYIRSEKVSRPVVSLLDLGIGMKADVVKIGGGGAMRQRLLDMGVTRGVVLKVERYAPLGDPVEILVKGYYLAIRKEEARHILVMPIEGEEGRD